MFVKEYTLAPPCSSVLSERVILLSDAFAVWGLAELAKRTRMAFGPGRGRPKSDRTCDGIRL